MIHEGYNNQIVGIGHVVHIDASKFSKRKFEFEESTEVLG